MISILIPTKEEPNLSNLIREIRKELRKIRHEVIVIDKSKVPPKLKNARVLIQQSDGLGNAVLEGLEHSHGDIIVIMDGDGSHRPEDITRLLDKTDENDIVIGSRFVRGGTTQDNTHRRIVSSFFRRFASLVLDLKIEDSMSGFSAIRREVYDNLDLKPLGYKINMEIVFKARKKYNISEVPITFLSRKHGRSKAASVSGIKEAFRILRYIFELRLGLR
jgi:dolichol-phosphate mannosyltransferase